MPPRKREKVIEHDRAAELERLRVLRKIEADAKKEAEDLKEDLVPFIEQVGSFLYVDEHGNKRMAYYSDSDMTYLDIDELQEAVDAGLVAESVLELVAPRKMDGEALKQALNAQRIPPAVAKKCVTVEKSRKTVRYKEEDEIKEGEDA